MSLSNSRLAYQDCYELFDKALDEPRGIRVEVASIGAASYLRLRLHHARQINRAENRATYPDPAEPLHARSIYDIFVVRIDEDNASAWVYLDKQKVEIGRIESIEETRQIGAEPVLLQIEGPKASSEITGRAEAEGANSFEITHEIAHEIKPSTGIRRR